MKYILGVKKQMTQIFDEAGNVVPVTLVKAEPIVVTQIKTKETDGYQAVQIGSGKQLPKRINKAQIGHMKDRGTFRNLREFRIEDGAMPTLGDKIEVAIFAPGDKVEVSAISKGKGFQGVVKRHGFKGGPRSHGQKHSEREPGSLGGGGRDGGRVAKNKRMAGRMGGDRVTVKNLNIVAVDSATNSLFISGALPGRRGTLVEVRS